MTSPIFAALDLGSNTVKAKLWRVEEGRPPALVDQRRFPVRLGRGTFASGRLGEDLIERAVAVMAEIRDTAERLGPATFRAVGTSALREAANAGELVERVSRRTGIEIEIVSPEREGYLTALGALRETQVRSEAPVVVIDIGGGSAEVTTCCLGDSGDPRDFRSISLPLGAVRLTEAHFRSDPPTSEQLADAQRAIDAAVSAAGLEATSGPVIGCGGTLVSVGQMAGPRTGPQGNSLSLEELKRLISEMIALSTPERAERFGIEGQRAEIIVAGALVLGRLMFTLQAGRVLISQGGLRDGLLVEHLQRARRR